VNSDGTSPIRENYNGANPNNPILQYSSRAAPNMLNQGNPTPSKKKALASRLYVEGSHTLALAHLHQLNDNTMSERMYFGLIQINKKENAYGFIPRYKQVTFV
jgi:hypothetical protein